MSKSALRKVGLAVLIAAFAAAASAGVQVFFGKTDDFLGLTLFMFVFWMLLIGILVFVVGRRRNSQSE